MQYRQIYLHAVLIERRYNCSHPTMSATSHGLVQTQANSGKIRWRAKIALPFRRELAVRAGKALVMALLVWFAYSVAPPVLAETTSSSNPASPSASLVSSQRKLASADSSAAAPASPKKSAHHLSIPSPHFGKWSTRKKILVAIVVG